MDTSQHPSQRTRASGALAWHAALALQQLAEESHGGTSIAPRLDQDVDHVPVLVDGPPQVLLPALDPHEESRLESGIRGSGTAAGSYGQSATRRST